LTCTGERSNLDRTGMEEAVKKLYKELEDLDRQSAQVEARRKVVKEALEIVGMRLASPEFVQVEKRIGKDVFDDMTLPECCTAILGMYGDWLDKNQVEHLVRIGGYPFNTKDPTNSVDVTLRRLVSDGLCEVEKSASGNRYRRKQA